MPPILLMNCDLFDKLAGHAANRLRMGSVVYLRNRFFRYIIRSIAPYDIYIESLNGGVNSYQRANDVLVLCDLYDLFEDSLKSGMSFDQISRALDCINGL